MAWRHRAHIKLLPFMAFALISFLNIIGADHILEKRSASDRFTYIGKHSISSNTYFRSHNNAEWESAIEDCQEYFGKSSGLAYIETQEELDSFTEYLDDAGDSAWLYWIGGEFDVSTEKWTWANGVPLESWAPWDENQPDLSTNASKIGMTTVDGVKFRSRLNVDTARYICEVRESESDPEICEDLDLVILIDSSWSVNYANGKYFKQNRYKMALEFAGKLATTWLDNPNNRVSVVVYSNVAETVFGLDNGLSKQEMWDQIINARYIAGSTTGNLGLEKALEEFHNAAPRSRPVARNIVYMSDGGADADKKELTEKSAAEITNAGIHLIGVGIGASVDKEELITLTDGKEERVFKTDQFSELTGLLRKVSRAACKKY